MKKLGSSGLPNGFLPGDREPLRPLDWVVRCLAALCVVALTVGLVHLAAVRAGHEPIAERHVFPGDRDAIRRATVVTALAMLASLAER